MPIFHTEIVLCSTAYIKADTAEQAKQLLESWHFNGVEFQTDQWIEEGFVISGASIPAEDDEDAMEEFPELSLSPTMTVYVQDLEGVPVPLSRYTESS